MLLGETGLSDSRAEEEDVIQNKYYFELFLTPSPQCVDQPQELLQQQTDSSTLHRETGNHFCPLPSNYLTLNCGSHLL